MDVFHQVYVCNEIIYAVDTGPRKTQIRSEQLLLLLTGPPLFSGTRVGFAGLLIVESRRPQVTLSYCYFPSFVISIMR